MGEHMMTVTEDKGYRPASPDKPERRFLVDWARYRWEVFVTRYDIRETGTPVYYAHTPEGYSAYGMTANEAVNDIAGIMRLVVAGGRPRKISLADVRNHLDPAAAACEEKKVVELLSRTPLLARLTGTADGFWKKTERR